MSDDFYREIEPLDDFDRALDEGAYRPLPDDWWVGVSDVVQSTTAIAAGRHKAVNLAGAATISAVLNALGDREFPFSFGGDGARFATSGRDADVVRTALQRTTRWVRDSLDLDLRVALVPVAELRAGGADVKVARLAASSAVAYALFSGGGMQLAEDALKEGRVGLPPADDSERPDLTGLSCQWGPMPSRNGEILSIIARPAPGADASTFSKVTRGLLEILREEQRLSPVPFEGPPVRWTAASLGLMSRVTRGTAPRAFNWARVALKTALLYGLFKLGLKVGGFDSNHYRQMVAANTDYQKFDDGLFLTVDCSQDVAREAEALLTAAESQGVLMFGLHRQKEALMTCIVPSATTDSHFHFLDGGGYTSAARMLKERHASA